MLARRLLFSFVNTLIILGGSSLLLFGFVKMFALDEGAPNFSSPNFDTLEIGLILPGTAAPAVETLPAAAPSPHPTIEPEPQPAAFFELPSRLIIPDIQLDAPVVPAPYGSTEYAGQAFRIWNVPQGFQAGWHTDSARLGERGNVVFNGHHNIHGQVFARLIELEVGSQVIVYGDEREYHYQITEKQLVQEKNQPLEVRLSNSRWIQPTADTRLTLVTCWPYETNTHRLILVAALTSESPGVTAYQP
jgi:LPXTG-site transpeptidase (sortase) family protein